jgi:Beta-propeller repeat
MPRASLRDMQTGPLRAEPRGAERHGFCCVAEFKKMHETKTHEKKTHDTKILDTKTRRAKICRFMTGLLLLSALPGFAVTAERGLPAFFIPNAGQAHPSIRYLVETPDLRAAFTERSAIFQVHGLRLEVHFRGASREVRLEGEEPLEGKANFLIGNQPANWRTALPVYHQIRYRDLYPGIDMTYGGMGKRIKSEFRVAPNADPRRIRLDYSGASSLTIDANGRLQIRGLVIGDDGHMEVREEAPVVYQEDSDGTRVYVPARYELHDGHTVSFGVGAYDRSKPLIIDPVLSYATYLGGSGMSAVTGVAVDTSGNLYVTGWTESIDFPIHDALQAANQGGVDAFVAKLNAAGDTLVYATYVGGLGDDRAAAIALNSSGAAYVTGSTASSNFPVANALSSTLHGGRDGFLFKLTADGSAMVFSTYLGGSNYDVGTAVAVDSSTGNVYVAGDTQSADFKVSSGVAQGTFGGTSDVFVSKFTYYGGWIFSTFLGGAAGEHAGALAVDTSGNVYIAGGTNSANFPVKGAIQAVSGGSQDAFLTKLSSDGSQIVYSTYLGGNGGASGSPEQANAVAVDSSGNAYVAGVTNSANFPVTAGAFQTTFNGVQDGFVTKVNPAGSGLLYSTYLGGTSFDWIGGLAIDSGGNAYVAGYTSSLDLATVAPVQPGFNGLYDAFVSKLNPQGNGLAFSTYYGGTGMDQATAIAVDSSGNMFVGGQTSSLDLPLQGALQSSNIGGAVGWVARIGVVAPPPQVPAAVSVSPASGSGNTVTFTAAYSDPAGAGALTSVALLVNTTASGAYSCEVTYSPGTNQFGLLNDAGSGVSTITAGSGTAQNSQCVLNGSGSGASLSGTSLTLTVALTFQPSFAGDKTVYLYAADSGSNTGWVARGTWTVTTPPPQPSVDSVSPANGTGMSQTFTFVFSDTQNALNVTGMGMLFATSVDKTNACYIFYDRIAGNIALTWDNAQGASYKPPNSTTTLSNSQCTVGTTSVSISGLSNIVTVAVTFTPAFDGTKNIYMYATDSGLYKTGYVAMGSYTVVTGGTPVANSVVPNSGTGPGQRYSFTVSDPAGSGYITGVAVLFNTTSTTLDNACYIVWDRGAGTMTVAYNTVNNGGTPVVPGTNTTAANAQCQLAAADSTVLIGDTSVVVTMDITFDATFFGAKNIYAKAIEGPINTGWVTLGGWTVTGGVPSADSASPASGSGSTPSYTFVVSDSSLAANISTVDMLFTNGAPGNITNACYMVYDRTNATIGLYGDDGVSFTTKTIGSSTLMANSQCRVRYTIGTVSGTSVTFQVNLEFYSGPFSGAKTVYLKADEPSASSGWVARGTWTVP